MQKEAKETMHWLRMLAKAYDKVVEECRELWQEAKDYAKMFSKIIGTLRKGNKKLKK